MPCIPEHRSRYNLQLDTNRRTLDHLEHFLPTTSSIASTMTKQYFCYFFLAATVSWTVLAIAEASGILPLQTITVNQFDSICPTSTQNTHSAAPVLWTTTAASVSQTPSPSTFSAQCDDSLCPFRDNDICIDANDQTFHVSCNAALTGLIMYPPSQLRPRTYAATFAECLIICDKLGGCQGVSWFMSNCLLYGSVDSVQLQNGSIAATRIVL